MARIKIESEGLDVLVPRYYENKTQQDKFKKLVDADNKAIKEVLVDDECTIAGYEVKKVTQDRSKLNHDRVIALNDDNKFSQDLLELGVIKTQYVVDEDALESLMYNGMLDKADMKLFSECLDRKEVVTLRVVPCKKESK